MIGNTSIDICTFILLKCSSDQWIFFFKGNCIPSRTTCACMFELVKLYLRTYSWKDQYFMQITAISLFSSILFLYQKFSCNWQLAACCLLYQSACNCMHAKMKKSEQETKIFWQWKKPNKACKQLRTYEPPYNYILGYHTITQPCVRISKVCITINRTVLTLISDCRKADMEGRGIVGVALLWRGGEVHTSGTCLTPFWGRFRGGGCGFWVCRRGFLAG